MNWQKSEGPTFVIEYGQLRDFNASADQHHYEMPVLKHRVFPRIALPPP